MLTLQVEGQPAVPLLTPTPTSPPQSAAIGGAGDGPLFLMVRGAASLFDLTCVLDYFMFIEYLSWLLGARVTGRCF